MDGTQGIVGKIQKSQVTQILKIHILDEISLQKSILVLNNHSKGTNKKLHVQCIWYTLSYYCFIDSLMYFWEDSEYESTWKRKGIRGEREKEMTKYLGKCLMFLSFLDRSVIIKTHNKSIKQA